MAGNRSCKLSRRLCVEKPNASLSGAACAPQRDTGNDAEDRAAHLPRHATQGREIRKDPQQPNGIDELYYGFG